MRHKLVNWLCKKATFDKRIILITGDLGYSVLEKFSNSFPKRFINAGVSEQNMISLAAGLASEGYLPYVYSIGIFPTFRCAEQIRNDIDYHQLPVTICAIGSGVAYGSLGYSHHAIQDIALIRSLPNLLIGTPSTPSEVDSILDYNFLSPKPIYLRLHKAGEKELHSSPLEISPGTPIMINSKKNSKNPQIAVICCSWIISLVSDLIKSHNQITIMSLPIWGQAYKKIFSSFIQKFVEIIIIEDHLFDGGFGSWILELVNEFDLKVKVRIFAIDKSVVGKVATENELIKPTLNAFKDYINHKKYL